MTETETTYTREQVGAALSAAYDLLDGMTDALIVLSLNDATLLRLHGDGPFTLADVSHALNQAADVLDPMEAEGGVETSDTIFDQTMINLGVNVGGYLLAHPNADLDAAVAAGWADLDDGDLDDSELDEGEPLPAQGTPERDALIVTTVLGWVS